MNSPPPDARRERPAYAIMLRVAAALMLSAMWALGKLAGQQGANLVELMFYRQALALPVVYGWLAWSDGPRAIATGRIDMHISRTVVGLTSMAFGFLSVTLLPLAESTTIGFTAPIFATIFSALFLKEQTGWHRWTAALVGFAGAVVMARPDSAQFAPVGLAAAIMAAVGVASSSILLRSLSLTEKPTAIVFWFTILSIPPLGLLMLWFGQAHTPMAWLILLGVGTCGGVAQLLLTTSLRWAPVSVVLPMDYSSIIWSTALGWLLWGLLPIPSTWAGAVLIVGSGLYILLREQHLGNIALLRAKAAADGSA